MDKGGSENLESGVGYISEKSGPNKITKTRVYDLLCISVSQKEPLRPGGTIYYG